MSVFETKRPGHVRPMAYAAFAAALLGMVLSGCAVGPDYRPPSAPAPDGWPSLPAAGQEPSPPTAGVRPDLPDAAWWTTLEDPILDELIERALAGNKTARQARARVIEARARRGVAAAGLFPSLGASASASRTQSDGRPGSIADPGGGSFGGNEAYSAGFDSIWELDLFGGRRRALEAAGAQLQATEADLRDVLVTLLGDVALSYTNVRTSQARLANAQRNLQAQGEALEIARWREAAGLASVLDVEQASASYDQTRAQIPALESSLQQGMNRLSVLLGEPPGAMKELLAERRPIPAAPLEIVAGAPADLLRRRPDIRAAERRLAAQTAQVGVATAALYPSLSLSGVITLQAASAGDVLNGFQTDRLGASLTMPLFRGGALRRNIDVQNALVDQALNAYEATVLAAYEEVDNALAAWANEQRRHAALIDAAGSARRAAELALVQYNSGLVDFQTVLSADRQLITLEDSLAVSLGELAANFIRLYKALGGGWTAGQESS